MNLIFTAIAIWYACRLIIYERGVFNLFGRLRALMSVDESAGYPNPTLDKELSYLFSCVICLSFWVSVMVVVINRQSWENVLIYGGIVMVLQIWSAD